MKVLIAIPPEKFRDEELLIPVKKFQEAGVTYELASTHVGVVMGVLGKKAKVNRTFEDVLLSGIDDYYALMIVGGPGTQVHLWNNRHLIELVTIFNTRQKVVAAIDNAPIVIAKAGILKKKIATVAPGLTVREMMKEDAIIQNKPVVYKDRIVTAMGFEAAEEFASIIIKYEKGNPEFVPTSGKAGFAF
ncbi:MAG: Intracellular protease 1 [Euryarchaeota archaeon ADurb.Bin294]|jgi:protease I|uniref:DJ-1/PfpI family protein n=1 Tax=Methanospirillum hungatei TaxID=2203 RepID=UPI0009CDE56E|nr:DJ-1/PfpI family protein [Methanospirillum hungatei]MBP9009660.1 DJ-1/PfpI family protein [Methanospirillum sp.]MCA1914930.1 DJ-1/PfpI family protein [Methanospirillum hungatei]OQA55139.1 MAG: Intracellular protease 1 [Euryarchaeota archaeon ADurb.Bin294]